MATWSLRLSWLQADPCPAGRPASLALLVCMLPLSQKEIEMAITLKLNSGGRIKFDRHYCTYWADYGFPSFADLTGLLKSDFPEVVAAVLEGRYVRMGRSPAKPLDADVLLRLRGWVA